MTNLGEATFYTMHIPSVDFYLSSRRAHVNQTNEVVRLCYGYSYEYDYHTRIGKSFQHALRPCSFNGFLYVAEYYVAVSYSDSSFRWRK